MQPGWVDNWFGLFEALAAKPTAPSAQAGGQPGHEGVTMKVEVGRVHLYSPRGLPHLFTPPTPANSGGGPQRGRPGCLPDRSETGAWADTMTSEELLALPGRRHKTA